jgi:hypothetical protein
MVTRVVLKEDDILLIRVPHAYFGHKIAMKSLYSQIKKQLLPRKNKVLILPDHIEISVIGTEEVKEYISKIDLWQLWDENGEEQNKIE